MNSSISTITIETERLILRKFVSDDAQSVFKNWASDKDVQKSYLEPVYATLEEVEQMLAKYIALYNTEAYYRWAIISKETNTCIGQIAFFFVDSRNNLAEIEYCIGKAFQKKGFATEAVRALTTFGFETLKFHRIQICTSDGNVASQRVIEKNHYKFEGMLRDYFFMDGEYRGRLYYSMLEVDYLSPLLEKNSAFI